MERSLDSDTPATASEDGLAEERCDRLRQLSIPVAVLERLFAYAPVGFQLYDAGGRSLLTNAAFDEMFGLPPPPGYNVLEDEAAERRGLVSLIRGAFAGEVVRLPALWYAPDAPTKTAARTGRNVAITGLVFPVFDGAGAVTHVGAVFKDVSSELLAREEAEAERDLLRSIVEQSGDGIIVADEAGVLRVFNPAAARQHGRPLQELPAAGWAQAYGLEDEEGNPLPLERTPLWRAMHGETVSNDSWSVRLPDGTRRLLAGTATPLLRPDGSLRGAMIITRDETERRRADEERRIAEFKDRVLGILGHDLRVPLTAIKAASATLARNRDAPLEELRASVERLVQRIESSADRMTRMIADVLDFTRARMGSGIPVERRTIDLGAVVATVVDELRAIHPQREITLESQGALAGRWDADRLAQVVQNLLGNAVAHGRPDSPVRVRLDGRDAEVRLAIHNEGVPIPRALLGRIFDPFRRGGTSSCGREDGVGLGLYIVRSIVEAHGGRIGVRSDHATGTTFTVRLPRA
jgi:PAS domain S-box-containing protein